jgi:S-adenosylmethionine hydrolase
MPAPSVITLLTDFGTADSYVGEMKGVLSSLAPRAQLVDITHDIPPGDVTMAQLVLSRVWHRFPAGTVHLAVVDPGVGSTRRAVALTAHGHRFVGPDNGLFTTLLEDAVAVTLSVPPSASATFHGRDVFAPAAAALATGTALEALGDAVGDLERRPLPFPRKQGRDIVGVVLQVDRFGNLVTNIARHEVPEGGIVRVGTVVAGPLRRTFAEVAMGAVVAYVGSGGTVEIAVRDGSAAAAFGVGRAMDVTITPP